jgi:hypothetical protein
MIRTLLLPRRAKRGRIGTLAGAIVVLLTALDVATSAAQTHVTGLLVKVGCLGSLTCPIDAGSMLDCFVSIENQDLDHGAGELRVVVDVPVGDGLRIEPNGCAPILAPTDGVADAGSDFTQCPFALDVDLNFCVGLATPIVTATATGFDADPVPAPFGFGDLPLRASASTSLDIEILPHDVRLISTLRCEEAGTNPVSCRLTVENEDAYHGVSGITYTKQTPFPTGPLRRFDPGCPTSLGPGDGTSGTGFDFASCVFTEPLEDVCETSLDSARVQVTATGTDAGGGSAANAGVATSGIVNVFSCGGSHLAGLSAVVICPSISNRTTIPCTIALENQDANHDLRQLTIVREYPFPGGSRTPVAGCATVLRPNDGVEFSGPDFTSCETEIDLNEVCERNDALATVAIEVSGEDGDPVPLARGGCGGLAVEAGALGNTFVLCTSGFPTPTNTPTPFSTLTRTRTGVITRGR